jgi:hypothetical protein
LRCPAKDSKKGITTKPAGKNGNSLCGAGAGRDKAFLLKFNGQRGLLFFSYMKNGVLSIKMT